MKGELLKIINHYGINKQLKHFNSEIFELNEAIFNYECEQTRMNLFLHEEDSKAAITEELADVIVMIEQIRYFYEINNHDVIKIMNLKIKRQIKRINEEEKNNE